MRRAHEAHACDAELARADPQNAPLVAKPLQSALCRRSRTRTAISRCAVTAEMRLRFAERVGARAEEGVAMSQRSACCTIASAQRRRAATLFLVTKAPQLPRETTARARTSFVSRAFLKAYGGIR